MARFACATWRPISVNTGGRMSANLGLVLHHQAGNGSLYGWFSNPAAKVSAHFWVGKAGQIEQYVDSATVAWHGMSLNSRYCGVETEGCPPSNPNEPLTEAQLAALGRLYAEGARVHGWRNALANADGQAGYGFHRMAVNTACPAQVRLDTRSDTLRRAFGGAATTPPPASGGGAAPKMTADYFGQRHNARHPDVRTWQAQMVKRGWRLDVDQHYGPQSENVCRLFQAEKHLGVDGLVGPQTWAASWSAPVT